MKKSYGVEIGICFMIGVFFAILVGLLNTNNIYIDELVTDTLTITEIQFVIILISLMIGIVIWAFRS